MPKSPWTITETAVLQYCEMRDWERDKKHCDLAERELLAIMERAHFVRAQNNGLELYRGAAPDRLRILIGDRGQVVGVLPGHDRAIGTGDAPAEQHLSVQIKIPRSTFERWVDAAGGRGNLSRWIVDTCNRAADKR